MTKKEYLHALNELNEKKKEFETEIKFTDDEISFLNKNYINENAKYVKGDIVKYLKFKELYQIIQPEYSNRFKILANFISRKGTILYIIEKNDITHRRLSHIGENDLELIKKKKDE